MLALGVGQAGRVRVQTALQPADHLFGQPQGVLSGDLASLFQAGKGRLAIAEFGVDQALAFEDAAVIPGV